MKHNEGWTDKLRYKQVKLVKMIERERGLWKITSSKAIEHSMGIQGNTPEMDKFVKFWEGIWESHDRTLNMPCMEKTREELQKKIISVKEFDIIHNGLNSEITKRKSWAAPGVYGIQNFWWKRFSPEQKKLKKAFGKIIDDNRLTSTC